MIITVCLYFLFKLVHSTDLYSMQKGTERFKNSKVRICVEVIVEKLFEITSTASALMLRVNLVVGASGRLFGENLQ